MDWEIYTQPNCSWCQKTKELLTQYNQKYVEYILPGDSNQVNTFLTRTNRAMTVPQVFHRKNLIGGYEDVVKYIEESVLGGHGDGF